MKEEEISALSIISDKSKIGLENNASDKAVTALKAAFGMVPGVGSILQEAVGVIIPNQRIDRIALTMECFAQKVRDIDNEILHQKMLSEEFTDLLEDAIPQAARSLSNDRREYIASFLKTSLTAEELEHIHEKKLLSLLGELNDAEMVFLRYTFLQDAHHTGRDFYALHESVLARDRASLSDSVSDSIKNAFRTSFQEKLFDLNLLQKELVAIDDGQIPEDTGGLIIRGAKIAPMGSALLRYIGHPPAIQKQ